MITESDGGDAEHVFWSFVARDLRNKFDRGVILMQKSTR
jgi:hypothetical protein